MITTNRDAYTASHLTPELKTAMQREAHKQGKSLSQLIYEWCREKMMQVNPESLKDEVL